MSEVKDNKIPAETEEKRNDANNGNPEAAKPAKPDWAPVRLVKAGWQKVKDVGSEIKQHPFIAAGLTLVGAAGGAIVTAKVLDKAQDAVPVYAPPMIPAETTEADPEKETEPEEETPNVEYVDIPE